MRHRGRRAIALALSGVLGTAALVSVHPAGAASGTVTEISVPLPDVTPIGLTVASNGNVWFTEEAGGIGKIDSTGKVTEYPVPKNAQGYTAIPDAITTGPGGTLWFTDASTAAPRVGRIDPATGSVAMFAIPTTGDVNFAGEQITGITAGPDGALWFTGNAAGHIGRITTSGSVTMYDTSAYGMTPYSITAGPDGGLWFTDTVGGGIGRIDPSTGAIDAYYPNNAFNGNPALADIAAGPDGALWFTEPGVGGVGRITTTGDITEYPVPTKDSAPEGIIAGSDGNLWFTEAGASNLGKITTSGAITEYPMPSTLSAPLRLAQGTGGQLWVSEPGKGALGHFDPAAPPSGAANPALKPIQSGSNPKIAALFQNQCPVNSTFCESEVTTGGSTKVGSFSLSLPSGAIRVNGYVKAFGANGTATLLPPITGQQFVSQPVTVPGGLIGQIPVIGSILGLSPIAMLDFNQLTVSQTLAGPITFSLAGFKATVTVNIHLNNALLGSDCVIGPVTETLSPTFTSNSPSDDPNLDHGWYARNASVTSDVAVPAATGCGPFGILDGIINGLMGFPSSSGNTVSLPLILRFGGGTNPSDSVASSTATASTLASALGLTTATQKSALTSALGLKAAAKAKRTKVRHFVAKHRTVKVTARR